MAREDDYHKSLRLAVEALMLADPERIASTAGADAVDSGPKRFSFRLIFFGAPVCVRFDGEALAVTRENGTGDLSLPEKILVCHYLIGSLRASAKGECITFREIPDGRFYEDAFSRRAKIPFLNAFGNDGELFRRAARVFNARTVDTNGIGMAFDIFPFISIQIILWPGDDEFAPEASFLYAPDVHQRLSAEDIAVMSGQLVYRLAAIAGGMTRNQASPA